MRKIQLDRFHQSLHSETLSRWLHLPHVAMWWGDAEQALEHVAQCQPEEHAVIAADGVPVGYMCWQTPMPTELSDAGLTSLPKGLVDVDILIGEPELLGQGIGTQALTLLLARLLEETSYSHAGLGTSVSNTRAIRAFEKAGFRHLAHFQDARWGPCKYMVADVRPR